MDIRPITAADTLGLRHQFLRPHLQNRSDCYLEGDEHPEARHFGGYIDGELMGIVSLHCRNHPDFGANGLQLRAMATVEATRGKGLGLALLHAAEAAARDLSADYIWANARSPALGFYQKAGYKAVSDEFEIPDIGPHYAILKELR